MAKSSKVISENQAAMVENPTYDTIIEIFKSRASVVKAPVNVSAAAQVTLTGKVEGILYVLIANGIAVVEPFDYKGADIEIEADARCFAEVINDEKKFKDAIVDGDIKVQGNAGKAIILASVLF